MSNYELMEKFVDIIEKERIRQNIKQSELYNSCGISSSAYAKFLKNKNTSFTNIIKILVALNMQDNIEGLLTSKNFISIKEIRLKQKNSNRKRVRNES